MMKEIPSREAAVAALFFSAALLPAVAISACSQDVTQATSAGSTGTTGSTGPTGTTTSTRSTTPASPCGDPGCAAAQLCVVPACRDVLGEECYFAAPDAGKLCPPGTVRGPQFDLDCVQPGGFACVGGCPPQSPFCVDLPGGCAGLPTCACLASDPCEPSNSGACHDADIDGGVLSCSLMP